MQYKTTRRPDVSERQRDEHNPLWKGDMVGKEALHIWVRNRLQQPEFCQICNKVSPYDLANISGKYLRNLNDWQWLCRRCHMISDGRLKELCEMKKRHRVEITSKRRCSICGGLTYFSIKRNCYDWYRNPLDKTKWVCKSCDGKMKYKIYIEQHKAIKA